MLYSTRSSALVLCVAILATIGCQATRDAISKAGKRLVQRKQETPDLPQIYERAAQHHDGHRNPVILIPGILGSRLATDENEKVVWGVFDRQAIDPEEAEGARTISLPMAAGVPLHDLKDNVRAVGVLDHVDVKIAGLPLEQQAYTSILRTLGFGGYRDEEMLSGLSYGSDHFTCFQFPYDWRRDNTENARRLHEFILEKAEYTRRERERRYGVTNEPVRFDIVAHSMGGLIARYYLRYGGQKLSADGVPPKLNWSGAKHVDRLVLVGTPSAGSVEALEQLVTGKQFSILLPKYDAALLGTMPSVYQLLPRVRHNAIVDQETGQAVDLYTADTWQRLKWGLLDPEQETNLATLLPHISEPDERRRLAYDHVAKCLRQAKAFHRALDVPASPPPGTSIHGVVGDAIDTKSKLAVDLANGKLSVIEKSPGDEIATRQSVLMDERVDSNVPWKPRLVSPIDFASVNFFFSEHTALTADPGFTDNVLYLLLEAPLKRPTTVGARVAQQPEVNRTRRLPPP